MRVLKKMSFDALVENISKEDKKNILGGSGSYTSVTAGSGSSNNIDGLARALFFMLSNASNNQAMSSMTSSSSWSSGSQSNSGGNSNQGWANTDGGVKTSNKSDISRFLEYISGQSNGQDIANFNPSMSDINSFVANELKFSVNNGVITLPDGTVWGGELNNVNVYHTSDPRSPNYNSATETFAAVAFGWDIKTMLSQIAVGGDTAGDFASYFKYLEDAGVVGLAVGSGMTIKEGLKDGFHDYHVADIGTQALIYGAVSTVPVAGWALGAAYFLGNYYTERNYGEGLYEHLNSN
jgi:hypothetical protein